MTFSDSHLAIFPRKKGNVRYPVPSSSSLGMSLTSQTQEVLKSPNLTAQFL